MDARLILILAVLLVGGTNGKKVFEVPEHDILSTENVEKVLGGQITEGSSDLVARAVSLAKDKEPYKELIKINTFEDSDCTPAETEKRDKICKEYGGRSRKYCQDCAKHLRDQCRKYPYAILVANIDHKYLSEIKRFEDDFGNFESATGMLKFSLEMALETFFSLPEQLDRREEVKVACDNFRQKIQFPLSYFGHSTNRFSNRNLIASLKSDGSTKNDSGRGLANAMEDCDYVIKVLSK
jgi:hypothetical protein